MAWGNKEGLIIENAGLKRENELLRERIGDLKEEIADLKKSLKYTQDALIAKESPDAYHDKKQAEEASQFDEKFENMPEEKKSVLREAKALQGLAREMERPLFLDAEDMIAQLSRAGGIPGMYTESLHGNDES